MSNLFNKYKIEKQDGSLVDPQAQYFILRIDTDPHARYAGYAYAASISGRDDDFADELRAWVKRYDGAVEHGVQRTGDESRPHKEPCGCVACMAFDDGSLFARR